MAIFRRSTPIDAQALAVTVADIVKASMPGPNSLQLTPSEVDRLAAFATGAFSPGQPFRPTPLGDPRDRPATAGEPRRSEFPSAVNLQLQRPLLPFSTLRAAGEIDLIRRCIQVRKANMLGFDWDFVISPRTIRAVMRDQDISSPGKAAQIARDKFEPELLRLREWWEYPDRANDYDFTTWLGSMLEEQLVVDALSIWPRRTYGGQTLGFEIIDGSTIKPLLDLNGNRPTPPLPAFQQVLYGLVRGDYTTVDDQDGGMTANQLVYAPRYRRSFTPYGNPEVEQALSWLDIYLKRTAWIRGEFTDGRTPDTWLKLPESSNMAPTKVIEWETAMNAELADPTQRRMLRMLPPGVTPERMSQFADLFKPDLDELIIKVLCSCFDVMPTEIGFPPSSGIGGKGHQEGEKNSAHRKATRPTAKWIEGIITMLSRRYLGCPPEIQFTLLGYPMEYEQAAEEVTASQVDGGRMTINEARAKQGLTMLEFAEADMVFTKTGSGIVFLDGAVQAQADAAQAAAQPPPAVDAPPVSATDPRPTGGDTAATPAGSDPAPQVGDPIAADEPVPAGFIRVAGHLRRAPSRPDAAAAEAKKFVAFTRGRHGRTWRPFTFEHLPDDLAAELNDAGFAGDIDAVKAIVADLGKARARRASRADKRALVAEHAPRLQSAVAGLFPSAKDLVDGWAEREAATKNTDTRRHAALAFITEHLSTDTTDVDSALDDFVTAGHRLGYTASGADPADLDDEEDDDGTPGRSRLQALKDQLPDMRDVLIAGAVGGVAGALLSPDPDADVPAAIADPDGYETYATVELTATVTAGTLDGAQAQDINLVRLTATAGECDFCQGYDGRILGLDDDSGMPPLHRGCQCDIEALSP